MTALEQKLLDELEKLEQEREREREEFMRALSLISQQQKQIIELLKTPPAGDNLSEVLEQALSKFSREFSALLERSNERLVSDLQQLLN